MHKLNNKRLIFVALFALIITLVVNFPSIIDVFYSDLSDIPHFPNGEGRPPFHDNNFPPGPAPFLSNPDKPFLTKEMFKIFQFVWYYILGFFLLMITSVEKSFKNRNTILISSLKVITILIIFYIAESIIIRQLNHHRMFGFKRGVDGILLGRYCFTATIAYLTGIIFSLINKRNTVEIENEKLKAENLQIRYNALANQMNPHFLFNSLNSLQYLLIEGEYKKSQVYVDELSMVFRYILQSSKKELVKVKDELEFLSSYEFLLKIRFEDKIRFDINISNEFYEKYIPVLSLQPLVENAINHNACSMDNPLIIRIYDTGQNLVVENNIIPKVRDEKGAGIGIENLKTRFQLLLNKEIIIKNDNSEFKVILPLK